MRDPIEILRTIFGFEGFRPGQQEIVAAILAGRDVVAIMPTGGGKSLCYQLPAIALGGLTVVISPLIALMRDQVSALREAGVAAGALTSANDPAETDATLAALREGELRLLYLAPERLGTGATKKLLARADIRRLAVDEAHCVSQWGHDFRPDYLRIGALRAEFDVPLAAFTATADPETRAEIAERLFAAPPQEFLRGFDRPNLSLAFEPKQRPQRRIVDFASRRSGQAGIVYCSSRRRTEALATSLSAAGLPALAYHAGLDAGIRRARQDRFLREEGLVMTATIAFGMGVDKPDIRYVVHADLPKSIEAYYQEIGRAGRDGLPADTLTLFSIDDIKLRRRQIDETDAPESRKRQDHARLQALLALAEAPRCRRMTLLAYFGEEAPTPCGNCDLCLDPPERYDGTEAAQKALSAILRTGERFGVEHLVQVLRGEMSDRVRQFEHDRLRTFGVGQDRSGGEWRAIFRQIYALGLAGIGDMGGWYTTEAGRRVLRGEKGVELRADPIRPKRPKDRPARAAQGLDPADQELFEALRETRAELARARGVPAYVIFHDTTLIDIAEKKPTNFDELAACHGVGALKLERFGEAVLATVLAGSVAPSHPARRRAAGRGEGALLDALRAVEAELGRGRDGTAKPLSCSTATLARIAEIRPPSLNALARVPGMDAERTARFGAAFLAVLAEA